MFERVESEEIALQLPRVQEAVTDLSRFSKVIKLKAFRPFTSAEDALENIHSIADGVCLCSVCSGVCGVVLFVRCCCLRRREDAVTCEVQAAPSAQAK